MTPLVAARNVTPPSAESQRAADPPFKFWSSTAVASTSGPGTLEGEERSIPLAL